MLVLIVQELSRELVRMTSRISSCALGLVMSSKGSRETEDARSSSVLGRLLATASRSDGYSHQKHLKKQQAGKQPCFVHSPFLLPCQCMRWAEKLRNPCPEVFQTQQARSW